MNISKQALNSIIAHQSSDMKTNNNNNNKNIKKKKEKLLKNAEQQVLNSIQFGTSLEELIHQAEYEIESIKGKKL